MAKLKESIFSNMARVTNSLVKQLKAVSSSLHDSRIQTENAMELSIITQRDVHNMQQSEHLTNERLLVLENDN